MRLRGHSALQADESGQVMPLLLVGVIVIMLGMAAFAIDVGHAYLVKRQLQASSDAAALVGAQALPDVAAAAALAQQYGPGGKNPLPGADGGVKVDVSTRCLAGTTDCSTPNAVVVNETLTLPTTFAKLLGIDNLTVHTTSTACSPCGEKPLDVMLVLDRTGSMCTTPSGAPDPACTDLNNARDGMKTFLELMDPGLDHVGLAVLPPATSLSARCATPTSASYNSTSSPYVIVPLSSDYLSGGALNDHSTLVSAIDCVQAGGSTSYATALEKAQQELVSEGRPGVDKIIVILSDGAANTGPTYYPAGSSYRTQPCHQGIASAQQIDAAGTTVFSIGYDLQHDRCQGLNKVTGVQGPEQPAITAEEALLGIAGSPNRFYNQPDPGQLRTIFTSVARDILSGQSRLVDNGA